MTVTHEILMFVFLQKDTKQCSDVTKFDCTRHAVQQVPYFVAIHWNSLVMGIIVTGHVNR